MYTHAHTNSFVLYLINKDVLHITMSREINAWTSIVAGMWCAYRYYC